MNLTLPIVGQKIKVIKPYWFDPSGTVPIGATGVVTTVMVDEGQTEPTIHVKLDQDFPELEDNILAFYPQCGPQEIEDFRGEETRTGTTIEWFYYNCCIIH